MAIALAATPAYAEKLVSGLCVNSQRSRPDRLTILNQLKAAGVKVIRTSFPAPARPNDGKTIPVWITEWGVENPDKNCPSDESAREPIVKETMDNLRALAAKGKFAAAIYYQWDSYPVKRFDPSSVFRCVALTESGKSVLME